jgi:predicted NBD/HSP70 family sugar kinase
MFSRKSMDGQNIKAIGVDIGGTDTKICLVNNMGEISDIFRLPTMVNPKDPAQFIEKVGAIAKGIVHDQKDGVIGIGISCLGLQNEDGSGPRYSVNVPGLNDFNLRDCLQSFLGLPVKVTNDLMSHTLAEYCFGVGRGCKRFMCVALGTGIGAATTINGELIKLWGGTSGDSGRIPLEPDSKFACARGIHGSAEALCGVAAIEGYAHRLYHDKRVTARDVIIACRTGNDPIAE